MRRTSPGASTEVAKFQLLPQSENIFLIYKDGWHPAEVSSEDPTNEWQWTKKAATISFRNPKKDGTFFLEYDARNDKFPTPQQVTVRSGDQVIGTFAADSKSPKLVSLPVTAAQLGSADMSEITLEVDQTFTPGGGDIARAGDPHLSRLHRSQIRKSRAKLYGFWTRPVAGW